MKCPEKAKGLNLSASVGAEVRLIQFLFWGLMTHVDGNKRWSR